MHHLLALSPVDGLDHEATEATAPFFQLADACNAVVRVTDDPGTVINHGINDLFLRPVYDWGSAHGVLEIFALITAGPDSGLFDSFFASLSDMHRNNQPPVVTVHYLVMLGGRFLSHGPQRT